MQTIVAEYNFVTNVPQQPNKNVQSVKQPITMLHSVRFLHDFAFMRTFKFILLLSKGITDRTFIQLFESFQHFHIKIAFAKVSSKLKSKRLYF